MIDDVCVIIPAFNPDEKLFLAFMKDIISNFSKVVVVNDGSEENYNSTFEKVCNLDKKIVLLKHCVNLGKGRALKTAFNYIVNTYKDGCIGSITADCDGQHRDRRCN